MNYSDVTLFFNDYKLGPLREALERSGTTLEEELTKQFEKLFSDLIPEETCREIENRIQQEAKAEAARREAARRFAVIHMHEPGDDFYFIAEYETSALKLAHVYREYLQPEVGKYALDSLARHFADTQMIDEQVYHVLCDAQPNDARIAICADFDFEKRQLSFCEQNDEEWRAYSLKDIAGAAYAAERRKYISPGERAEMFADYLSGKELLFADGSEDLSADESPGLTM